MGLLKLYRNNVSKYRYTVLSYMLVEYFCGLDDIMHIIDGTVNIRQLDIVSFIKCGLIDNKEEAIKKVISGKYMPEELVINDESLVNIINVNLLLEEFENAMKSFIDSFKIEKAQNNEDSTSNKSDYHNPDYFKVNRDWEGLELLYVSNGIGTKSEFLDSTFGEIMTKINSYCTIKNGKFTFNKYERSGKTLETENKLFEMAKKLKEEQHNG